MGYLKESLPVYIIQTILPSYQEAFVYALSANSIGYFEAKSNSFDKFAAVIARQQ